jgi:hypothetical protein
MSPSVCQHLHAAKEDPFQTKLIRIVQTLHQGVGAI